MTDRMLFLGWGQVARGREERALEVFNESVQLYGRMQQDGRIDHFDVALLDPHAGDLAGYIVLHGSAAQIGALRGDEEFRRLQAEVSLIVDDQRVIDGREGDGIAESLAIYADSIARVVQHA
jgi:hypothetical protein